MITLQGLVKQVGGTYGGHGGGLGVKPKTKQEPYPEGWESRQLLFVMQSLLLYISTKNKFNASNDLQHCIYGDFLRLWCVAPSFLRTTRQYLIFNNRKCSWLKIPVHNSFLFMFWTMVVKYRSPSRFFGPSVDMGRFLSRTWRLAGVFILAIRSQRRQPRVYIFFFGCNAARPTTSGRKSVMVAQVMIMMIANRICME